MTTKKSKTRGSKKLSASRKSSTGSLSALTRSVRALDRTALKNGIETDGTPIPDIIRGSLIVRASSAGSALNGLLKIPGAKYKSLELFPIGIPFPDQFKIVVDGKLKH